MRTRSRSHNSRLALAGLGLMAALTALVSDARPTLPADAAVGDAAPAGDVRDIDFASLAQPGSACADALDTSAPPLIGVRGGASDLLDERSLSRLEIGSDVLYADLDDDGDDEAVVHAVCTYGANGAQHTVQVWAANGRLPMLVDTVAGPPADVAEDSALPPSVVDIAAGDGVLEVTFSHYADGDPNCCPSGQTVVTYELDAGLAPVGEPETRQTEA